MPNYITLANHEARRLAGEGSLLVVRPVVPQPTRINDDDDGTWEWRRAGEYYDDLVLYTVIKDANPLGAPGDVLLCKETWLHTGLGYKYRVSDPQWGKTCHWRPASTMPAWAVRFRSVVCEAGAMRAGDMTEEHLRDTGIAPDMEDSGGTDMAGQWVEVPHYGPAFAAYWNRRFRKYPWEDNPWVWTAVVETPEKAARDEWAQREADKRRAMLEDMWWEEQNA